MEVIYSGESPGRPGEDGRPGSRLGRRPDAGGPSPSHEPWANHQYMKIELTLILGHIGRMLVGFFSPDFPAGLLCWFSISPKISGT